MSIKIDQAFIKAFIDAAFGLPIAHDNLPYVPVAGTAYAELLMLPNSIEAQSLADLNETSGIFRVILRYPVNVGSIGAKTMADAIMAEFPIGSKVTYDNQSAQVTKVHRQPGYPEDGWFKLVITVRYLAFIVR